MGPKQFFLVYLFYFIRLTSNTLILNIIFKFAVILCFAIKLFIFFVFSTNTSFQPRFLKSHFFFNVLLMFIIFKYLSFFIYAD